MVKRGFLIKEMILYLIFGSLLLVVSLNLFKVQWLSYQRHKRVQEVTTDFINVSERVKYDLLQELESIEMGPDYLSIRVHVFDKDPRQFVLKDHRLMMVGNRLVYQVNNGTDIRNIYLSSLIKGIQVVNQDPKLEILFDYGDYSFRRCYRIDHIPEKRLSDG